MQRPYNFSAGPAAIATEVLQQAADEMLDWPDAQGRRSGMSVMEMSHRGKEFISIYEAAEAALRELAPKNDFGARMPHVDAGEFIEGLAARPLAAEPGRAFRYGFSTDVLGLIVAALVGILVGLWSERRWTHSG